MTLGIRILSIFLLVSGPAVAQQLSQAQASAIRSACRADYQSYCSNVPTGGSAALQCLQQHVSQVSPGCQTAVNGVSGGAVSSASPNPQSRPPAEMSPRAMMAIMRRACGPDFHTYCRGIPLGGGKAISCLAANESRLSPACQTVMAEARGR